MQHAYVALLENPYFAGKIIVISCQFRNNTVIRVIVSVLFIDPYLTLTIFGASISKLQYSQKWYMRHIYENSPNENGLPHNVAWIVCMSCSRKFKKLCSTLLLNGTYVSLTEIHERKLFAPLNGRYILFIEIHERKRFTHTIAEWYARLVHWNSREETVFPTLLLNGMYVSFKEIYLKKTVSSHCSWMVPRVHNICMVESVCTKALLQSSHNFFISFI